MKLVAFVLLVYAVNQIDGLCNFPTALTGGWTTSYSLDITFTSSTTVTGFSLTVGVNTFNTWQCAESSGDKYILRSSLTALGSSGGGIVDSYHYRCLELHQVTDDIFYYYQLSPYQSGVDQYVIGMVAGNITTVCTRDTNTQDVIHNTMVRTDAIATAGISCPSMIIGSFRHSVDGTPCAMMDSCTDTEMAFNNTGCNDVSLSGNGTVRCVVSLLRFGGTYLTAINPNNNVNFAGRFRFVCFTMAGNDTTVLASVQAQDCDSNQTEASGGIGRVVFDMKESCPSDDSSGVNVVAIVVPVVLVCILVPLVVLGSWYYVKKKKCKKSGMSDIDNNEKAKPTEEKRKMSECKPAEKETKKELPSEDEAEVEEECGPDNKPPSPAAVLQDDAHISPNNRLTPIQ